jgi:hypothetical protein
MRVDDKEAYKFRAVAILAILLFTKMTFKKLNSLILIGSSVVFTSEVRMIFM